MERFVGKIAVITGSSSGSGLEIAKYLLRKGVHVAGIARRTDRLQKIRDEVDNSKEYKGKFYPITCDLTNEAEIISSMKWIFENLGPVHILLNNAMIFERTRVLEATSDQVRTSFDLSVRAVILCTKEVVKNMVENSTAGHIINIIGIAGKVILHVEPNIYMLYSSAKHALRVITEGTRREVTERNLPIKVTNLSPGYVRTDLSANLDLAPDYKDTIFETTDVAEACMLCLDTDPDWFIAEMEFVPLHLRY